MKKQIGILALCATILGLAACNDLSSPQATIGTAYQALKSNHLKDFVETLKDKALEKYGNSAGMSELQNLLAGLDVKPGRTEMTDEKLDPMRRPILRNYQAEVLVKKTGEKTDPWRPFLQMKVECQTSYMQSFPQRNFPHRPWDPDECWLPGGNPPAYCSDYYSEHTWCQITQIDPVY